MVKLVDGDSPRTVTKGQMRSRDWLVATLHPKISVLDKDESGLALKRPVGRKDDL